MSFTNYNGLKSYGGTYIEQKLNDLVDAVQANSLCQGVGYKLSQYPNGTILGLSQAQPTYYPFQLIDATTISGGTTTYNVRVVCGQVIAFVNGSGGQVALTPSGFNPGDKPAFTLSNLTAGTNGTVNLQVTTDPTTYQVNPSTAIPGITYETTAPTDSTFVGNLAIGSLNIPSSGAMTITQGIEGVVGYINGLGMHTWY